MRATKKKICQVVVSTTWQSTQHGSLHNMAVSTTWQSEHKTCGAIRRQLLCRHCVVLENNEDDYVWNNEVDYVLNNEVDYVLHMSW